MVGLLQNQAILQLADLAARFVSLLFSMCGMKIAGLFWHGVVAKLSSIRFAGHIDRQRAHGLHCLGRRTSTDRILKDV